MSRAHDTLTMHPNAKGRDKFTEIGDSYTTLIKQGSGWELGQRAGLHCRIRGTSRERSLPGQGACWIPPKSRGFWDGIS